jgi:hypothetical protein
MDQLYKVDPRSLFAEVLPVCNHQLLQGQERFFLNFIVAVAQQAHNWDFSANMCQDPVVENQ